MAVNVDARSPWAARARWLLGAAAVVLFAFGMGAFGLLGRSPAVPAPVELVGSVARPVPALDCPGGDPVTWFGEGDRVFVTARSGDGEWLAVRDPAAEYETVWVAASTVAGARDGFAVPVAECATPAVEP